MSQTLFSYSASHARSALARRPHVYMYPACSTIARHPPTNGTWTAAVRGEEDRGQHWHSAGKTPNDPQLVGWGKPEGCSGV
ncbi:hypothetical protein HaLaN_04279 [Haematococcus lacustris]|uniref:Uncharacterized protein n=1 Tax=Haematococcus lacustris TaxID=44745 RepID=A0A699YG66_HAELA|nr:hypothetical protein HaLaN_04279 [Haematococcus lacustris]